MRYQFKFHEIPICSRNIIQNTEAGKYQRNRFLFVSLWNVGYAAFTQIETNLFFENSLTCHLTCKDSTISFCFFFKSEHFQNS
jgi:hypothetical protein